MGDMADAAENDAYDAGYTGNPGNPYPHDPEMRTLIDELLAPPTVPRRCPTCRSIDPYYRGVHDHIVCDDSWHGAPELRLEPLAVSDLIAALIDEMDAAPRLSDTARAAIRGGAARAVLDPAHIHVVEPDPPGMTGCRFCGHRLNVHTLVLHGRDGIVGGYTCEAPGCPCTIDDPSLPVGHRRYP